MTSVIAVSRISYLLPPSELKMGKREHRPSGNPGKRRKSNLSDPIKFCDIGHPYKKCGVLIPLRGRIGHPSIDNVCRISYGTLAPCTLRRASDD